MFGRESYSWWFRGSQVHQAFYRILSINLLGIDSTWFSNTPSRTLWHPTLLLTLLSLHFFLTPLPRKEMFPNLSSFLVLECTFMLIQQPCLGLPSFNGFLDVPAVETPSSISSFSPVAHSSTLKTVAAGFSESPIPTYHTTRHAHKTKIFWKIFYELLQDHPVL